VHPGSLQGLSVFGVATVNDSNTGLFRTYYEAGMSFRGPFSGRDDDIISLGWAQAVINPRLQSLEQTSGVAVQSNEQILELNYGAQVAPWLIVRPGAQYVVNPGAYGSRPDSFVFALHVEATL
jgi:porin